MQFRCIICTNWTIEDQEQDDDVRESRGASLEKFRKDAENSEAVAAEVAPDEMTVTSEDDVVTTPSPDAVIALPEMEAKKRMDDLLTQGGLLLLEVRKDGRTESRRLELDEKGGYVTWNVERVLGIFGNPFHNVDLKGMRVMCDKNIVKIGAGRRKDFHVFQAADEDEATTLADCLNSHAKKASEATFD